MISMFYPSSNSALVVWVGGACRRLAVLFFKLNADDVSGAVCTKLLQLCAALEAGDYATATHIQVRFRLMLVERRGAFGREIKLARPFRDARSITRTRL
jgi:hypothetical protein